jgi:hypothetical protein
MLKFDVPATALALPVSVSVQETAPEAENAGELQLAVMPAGNPEAIETVAPVALEGITTPPRGVTVTVSVAVASDCMESEVGETLSWIPGACATWRVRVWVDVRPSPATVILSVAEPTAAVEAAVKVRVSLSVPAPAGALRGLADQPAVTPEGSPLMEKVSEPV